MDRNLGALAATTAKPSTALAYKYFGVLYQHGRPTPFSGQGIGAAVKRYTIIYKGDATAINSNDTEGIGGYTPSNTAVSSVTDAIKTPNTYYYWRDATLTSNQWTWYYWTGGDISLWSDYGTNKSIYDPCPYGYRVPITGSWSSWTSISAWTANVIEGGAVWSSIWWPATGGRNSSSGALTNVGSFGYYWSSTCYTSSAYRSYYLYFSCDGYVHPSNNDTRSTSLSVRCVQERGRVARPKASEWGGEAESSEAGQGRRVVRQ